MPHESAVEIIVEGRGTHFDADMVDAFVDIQQEFRAIALRFSDSDSDMGAKRDYGARAGLAWNFRLWVGHRISQALSSRIGD